MTIYHFAEAFGELVQEPIGKIDSFEFTKSENTEEEEEEEEEEEVEEEEEEEENEWKSFWKRNQKSFQKAVKKESSNNKVELVHFIQGFTYLGGEGSAPLLWALYLGKPSK